MYENPIILASSSPRRKELLSLLFPNITFVHPDVEEVVIHRKPVETAEENARLKCRASLKILGENNSEKTETIIVSADTIVVLGTDILGKPDSLREASIMLKRLSGATHTVITGVSLHSRKTGQEIHFHEKTAVSFNQLSDSLIESYLSREKNVLDAAGSYKLQGIGAILIHKIEGSFTNVLGFPVEKFLIYYNRFFK